MGHDDSGLETEVGALDELGIDGKSSLAEARHIAVVAGVVHHARIATDEGDASMAELEQVLHRRQSALPVARPDAGQ